MPASKKIPAGICGILLGSFGVHKFVMGFPQAGLTMLGIHALGWILSCTGLGGFIIGAVWLLGFVEGIIYLVKDDRDFYRDYIIKRQEWL